VEVVSGDTVVVAVPRASGVPEERRVYLSSLRAPRLARRGEEKEQPWASEAKELLRRTLIGRDVTVSVEYTRSPPAGGAGGEGAVAPAGDRINTYATVTFSTRKGEETNAAVVVVCEWITTCTHATLLAYVLLLECAVQASPGDERPNNI